MGSSVLDTTQDTDTTKMLPFSVVLTVLAASVANCHPGGYTGLGGLYKNMNQNADYMQAAKHAAKMAVNIFDEVESETVERARKSTVYVPTFFTRLSCSSSTDLAEILRLMTCLSTTMSTDQPISSSSTRDRQYLFIVIYLTIY